MNLVIPWVWAVQSLLRYVARCRADSELYGRNFMDESDIEDWLEFSHNEAPLIDVGMWN